MFNHDHHQTILTILNALNSDLLKESQAHFGGGTLLALRFNEYRWSQDIDLICPVLRGGYRALRNAVSQGQYKALFPNGFPFELPREIQTNQYGIRFPIKADGHTIKFEIIAEARIELDPPETPEWGPIPCLSLVDCFAEKLMANADRWYDQAIHSRDLIDLSVLRKHSPIPARAIEKAEGAYEVLVSLKKAIQAFQKSPEHRRNCFETLQIDRSHVVEVIDGLDLLAEDLRLPVTLRETEEEPEGLQLSL